MAVETLTQRRLNRALLARQHLLERSRQPLTRVLEDVGGLQTQYAPSGYVGLWARVAGFHRDMLTQALEDRTAIQATMMRVTIHLVAARDYWPMTAGIRRLRRQDFERVARREIDGLDMPAAAHAASEELRDGPLRIDELMARMGERGVGAQAVKWVGQWVDLVRVPPSGTWDRRRADIYALAEKWLSPDRDYSEEDGLELLVRRYLGAFGPARPAQIANWAGVPVPALGKAVEAVAGRRFVDELGQELVDLADAPLPPEHTPAPVRFLPTWDATLLVHARRTQILPEEHRPKVFNTRTPHSVGTFLVDGRVCGTWRIIDGTVVPEPFAPLPIRVRREVDGEAARLTDFHR